MKKAVILIDGQNLFYNLKDMSLKENEINWGKLFSSIIEGTDELVRTYWFRPQKLHDSRFNTYGIKNQLVFKKFNTHYAAFKLDPASLPSYIQSQVDTDCKEAEDWIKEQKRRFESIEYNYDQISLSYSDIEIVKKGYVKIDPYKKIYLSEKGVDIALCVRMIELSLTSECDKIILISGDFDYAEAINFVKNKMKKVHIVKVHKGIPPKNKSMARDLSVLADKVIDIYESELKSIYSKTTIATADVSN